MPIVSERRRRIQDPRVPPTAPGLGLAEEGWITLVGHGSGFHDCPLCRELGADAEAIVNIRMESLPELLRAGWIDDLLELVGRHATVRVMGREMQSEPVEELSMESFLARLGYQ